MATVMIFLDVVPQELLPRDPGMFAVGSQLNVGPAGEASMAMGSMNRHEAAAKVEAAASLSASGSVPALPAHQISAPCGHAS